MIISCWLFKGIVYIPTEYEIERGFHCTSLPLGVVPVQQTEKLRDALYAANERGNPPISRDEAADRWHSKDQPILAAAGARSWRDFERRLSGGWSIVTKNGIHEIEVDRPRRDGAGWEADRSKSVIFPAGTPLDDVIDRLIAMMQEKARQ